MRDLCMAFAGREKKAVSPRQVGLVWRRSADTDVQQPLISAEQMDLSNLTYESYREILEPLGIEKVNKGPALDLSSTFVSSAV